MFHLGIFALPFAGSDNLISQSWCCELMASGSGSFGLIVASGHVLILHGKGRLRSAHLMRFDVAAGVRGGAANGRKGGNENDRQANGSGFDFHT